VPLDRPGGEPAQPDLRALPWLKFNRAMSIPAATSSSIRSGLAVAGPSVHTIFARRGEAMADVELVMTLPVRGESIERVSDGPLVEVDATADACRCDRLEEPTSAGDHGRGATPLRIRSGLLRSLCAGRRRQRGRVPAASYSVNMSIRC
jgi:hypothetical protein